jgi:hypothetical protein
MARRECRQSKQDPSGAAFEIRASTPALLLDLGFQCDEIEDALDRARRFEQIRLPI